MPAPDRIDGLDAHCTADLSLHAGVVLGARGNLLRAHQECHTDFVAWTTDSLASQEYWSAIGWRRFARPAVQFRLHRGLSGWAPIRIGVEVQVPAGYLMEPLRAHLTPYSPIPERWAAGRYDVPGVDIDINCPAAAGWAWRYSALTDPGLAALDQIEPVNDSYGQPSYPVTWLSFSAFSSKDGDVMQIRAVRISVHPEVP